MGHPGPATATMCYDDPGKTWGVAKSLWVLGEWYAWGENGLRREALLDRVWGVSDVRGEVATPNL